MKQTKVSFFVSFKPRISFEPQAAYEVVAVKRTYQMLKLPEKIGTHQTPTAG
jgi:hypothetical protein